VPEQILEEAIAVAPKHVLQRHLDRGAGLDGAGKRRVRLGHEEMNRHRGALP